MQHRDAAPDEQPRKGEGRTKMDAETEIAAKVEAEEAMTRRDCRAVVSIDDDGDSFTLRIKLMDERSIMLTYNKAEDRWPTWVFLADKFSSYEFDKDQMSFEEFEDWAKIATGAMRPERERRWLCQICGENLGFGPMLPDDVWNAIAPNPRGLMCEDCMRARLQAA
jgi:hypothetical protein